MLRHFNEKEQAYSYTVNHPAMLLEIFLLSNQSEKIKIGSFPSVMAEVLPDMYLDRSAVACMQMFGVTRTPERKKAIEKMRTDSATLKLEDYFSWRTFLSSSTGMYTSAELDKCIRQM